ncbi:MAG: DUF456 domain-containing protein [Verrucomicrobiaceae bacterium]|nr:DUF456 domain-containing protein [Verrucomicrobiaceae bacterium]
MLEWLYNAWTATMQFFRDMPWEMVGVWSLTISLLAVGFVGAIVPFLPGPALILVAGVLHTLLRPESAMSTFGIVLLIVWFGLAYAVDFFSGMMGARWFGASRWGIAGVFIGGIAGLFFGPIGILIGPLVGGFAFEMLFAKQRLKPAMKSTWGTIVGTGVGLVLRILIALAMITTVLVDALWW